MSEYGRGWQFWIDRGGTFTDVVARSPEGALLTRKLLSEDPDRYEDAAIEGIREVLGLERDQPIRGVDAVRMGTTVATNALLERKGDRTLLVVNRGFKDALRIGYQARPHLFELDITLPEMLYEKVVEVEGRIGAQGEELIPLDRQCVRESLRAAFEEGIRSVAIVLMHAYRRPEHEAAIAEIARAIGFTQVSTSAETSPLMKIVGRGDTTVADAYLSPLLRRYVDRMAQELGPDTRLMFMQSNGGLTDAARFQGKDAILSGPAGGIVGAAGTATRAGFERVITFDMGGTSTDVAHYHGAFERAFETEVAGVRMRAPMMLIHTVAAGGGSVCSFEGSRYRVGPDSAGADPGPACYRRRGPLCVTDCNLLLGRLQPDFFPRVFGPSRDQPLGLHAAMHLAEELAARIGESTGETPSVEALASGFLRIAVDNMANAIKAISVRRGHDITAYTLNCFGGAGGQHACLVADALGMSRVMIHPFAGLLSAYGMGLADIRVLRDRAVEVRLDAAGIARFEDALDALASEAKAELTAQGIPSDRIRILRRAHIRYEGTDTSDLIEAGDIANMRSRFESAHRSRYGFAMPDKPLILEAASVEAIGSPDEALPEGSVRETPARKSPPSDPASPPPPPADADDPGPPPERPKRSPQAKAMNPPLMPEREVEAFFDGRRQPVPVFRRASLAKGDIVGPAIVIDDATTIVVEPGWQAALAAGGDLILERIVPPVRESAAGTDCDPIMLEVFNNRFMSIAEQMGLTLQNTAHSVNIKERLDFSCALFDPEGMLVANAPHIPIHLGSMSESVRTVLRENAGKMKPGDVFCVNAPYNGGTHLPDITVITPVFEMPADPDPADPDPANPDPANPDPASPDPASPTPQAPKPAAAPAPSGRILFFVASRGHHADIGGSTPGSMPPDAKTVEEEGILFDNFRLVDGGRFLEDALRSHLAAGPWPARNPDQNVADLKAQIAAGEKGIHEVRKMIEDFGLQAVHAYMHHVQDNAKEQVRRVIDMLQDGYFELPMDDGACICVRISIDRERRKAVVDFTGTSAQRPNNFNAPAAVARSAALYVFRCLIKDDIPLNEGCLAPVRIVIPEGSMLSPQYPAAVAAGNVETSQAITDALFGALGVAAQSQGTMNNLLFGNDRCQYYETVCGGAGAGPDYDGADAVHTNMTNTRLTDPEILEWRYPVVLERFEIDRGSGGAGRHKGGDGVTRRIRFCEEMMLTILSHRREIPPYGMTGGEVGRCGRNRIERKDGRLQTLPGLASAKMEPGDVFILETPSGGGYGAPPPDPSGDHPSANHPSKGEGKEGG
ncbi:MAG: hydantoinase B/oxoprolinase family protein [Ectothiorhodospiraceae bacterium AqS1]|nr:hydantoinase B/oxoprolinase family protein [Ectothiorhodospiraceae bacterium AqS1]